LHRIREHHARHAAEHLRSSTKVVRATFDVQRARVFIRKLDRQHGGRVQPPSAQTLGQHAAPLSHHHPKHEPRAAAHATRASGALDRERAPQVPRALAARSYAAQ
jgi:hypothetical protein